MILCRRPGTVPLLNLIRRYLLRLFCSERHESLGIFRDVPGRISGRRGSHHLGDHLHSPGCKGVEAGWCGNSVSWWYAREGGVAIPATLWRLHLLHGTVSPAKSRRVTPLCRTNSSGKDIPDAAAYLRNRNPSLPGYQQFTGNSAVSAGVSVHFTQERL